MRDLFVIIVLAVAAVNLLLGQPVWAIAVYMMYLCVKADETVEQLKITNSLLEQGLFEDEACDGDCIECICGKKDE